MNSPTDETQQEAEQPVEDRSPDQPVTPAGNTNMKFPESRKSSKFSNIVTLVTSSSRPAENSGHVRPGQIAENSVLRSLSSSRKRTDPRNVTQKPEEAEDIGRFVFFHPREKRYLDGLRRKTIPLQTFALSLSLGVAIGCVVAIVLSLTFRIFWNFQESSPGVM